MSDSHTGKACQGRIGQTLQYRALYFIYFWLNEILRMNNKFSVRFSVEINSTASVNKSLKYVSLLLSKGCQWHWYPPVAGSQVVYSSLTPREVNFIIHTCLRTTRLIQLRSKLISSDTCEKRCSMRQ